MNDNTLKLVKFQLDESYSKEWNTIQKDYLILIRNGQPIRETLYRKGMFEPNLNSKYFLLLKYEEAYYSDDILRMSDSLKSPESRRKHLQGKWCILDNEGNEIKTFNPFETPYLVKNSIIYSLDRNYYNLLTGEKYCYASGRMESDDFLFLENKFDEDKSKRGVMKIDKKTGEVELFPLSREKR